VTSPDTLVQAAATAAGDEGLQGTIGLLCRRIELTREPAGLTGTHAAALAERLNAPLHLVLVAIAQLSGRDVLEVAAEASPTEAPAARSLAERRRERAAALERLSALEPRRRTGDVDLDALVASHGCFGVRAAARLVEPRLGRRDPGALRSWERTPLVAVVGSEDLLDDALRLLAEIRSRPHIRAAWDRWRRDCHPTPGSCASRPPAPPDRRVRHRGEREMGELRRRILRAKEIPVPCAEALRWPVIRYRRAQPDEDGVFRFRDLLGDVECSFKPTVRHLRLTLGAALVLRESSHVENPMGDGRRTVLVSDNALNLAATGRDCHGEEYAAIDRWLYDMLTARLQASDEHASTSKRNRSLDGTPIEDAYIRLGGGELMPFTDWYELAAEKRPARLRGAGPTLLLTFTEAFHRAVIRRSEHILVSKEVVWAARDELVTLLRMESHTGVQRDRAAWEMFAARPFLRQVGLHGSDQRAAELLVEDDLHAVEEAWTPVRSVALGDSKKGFAWLRVDLDRRADRGRRRELTTRRTRTRTERRTTWANERPERAGRRRTFAPPGTPGRSAQRRAAAAERILARATEPGARRAKTASRRRQTSRHRARVQRDLDAARRARRAAA
jgi:hypothetical protein